MNELEEAMDTVTKRLEEAEQREERMLQSVMPDTAFNKESVPDSGTASDAVSAAEEQFYRKKCVGIYPRELAGKTASCRCGGTGLRQPVAFIQTAE